MPADEGVALAEVPPVPQPKPGKSTQVADAKSAAEAKIAAAKTKNPGPVQPADTAAEPATPAAPWMTDLKQAAASPQLLPWVTDLKQEPVPAPTQASFAANQVTRKEVDLSLKAPAKADPAPGKATDTAMVIPAVKPADTATSWSANVSAKPRPKADAPGMGGEVAHRDVDLSLGAPSAKQPDKTAAAPEWAPQVASPAAH